LQNWSFEQPGTVKISTGYDTIPYCLAMEPCMIVEWRAVKFLPMAALGVLI